METKKPKQLIISTPDAKSRVEIFNRICELQKVDVAKLKKDLSMNSPMVSIQNINDLCKIRSLRITIDYKAKTLEVICPIVELIGEQNIKTPEFIQNTPVDNLPPKKTIEDKLEDIEEDEEADPF
ncbi:MAG: hypothetical protein ACK5B9_11495 [Flavobacteriia bacterium]|jgi:hypothetical protein